MLPVSGEMASGLVDSDDPSGTCPKPKRPLAQPPRKSCRAQEVERHAVEESKETQKEKEKSEAWPWQTRCTALKDKVFFSIFRFKFKLQFKFKKV